MNFRICFSRFFVGPLSEMKEWDPGGRPDLLPENGNDGQYIELDEC